MTDSPAQQSPAALHEELIEAAILAPTPDNNQPWLFESAGSELQISVDPTRTLPSDVNGMFDLLGIGGAIENICIAARERGLKPGVRLLSEGVSTNDGDEPTPVAALTFQEGGAPDPLFANLKTRCTNRKLYSKTPPADDVLARLTESASAFGQIQVNWVCDRPRIKAMAQLVSGTDLIRFQYQPFHQELVRQLRFSASEAERTRDGLDLRTLEMPPGSGVALRALRSWTVMNCLHQMRLGWLLTVPSAMAIRRSGALGVITCSEATQENFVAGGRAFERLWLQADKEGLSLQPLGSPSIFFAHLELLGGAKLSEGHQAKIRTLTEQFRELVAEAADRRLLMVARIGESAGPSHRSIRREVGDVMIGKPIEDSDSKSG